MKIKSYKDLEVWQKSIELAAEYISVAKDFPKDELYGLINQMRRCAVSIPSNIAEGKARNYINEYTKLLFISLGSCAELETQIIISKELSYLSNDTAKGILERIDHISRMLRNLIKGLKK